MTSVVRPAGQSPLPDDRPDRQVLDRAELPGGGQLRLVRDGQDFEIWCDDEQLMSNWSTASEQALAALACERLGPRANHVLIGGLGMGFTLGAALKALPRHVIVTVAELVPEVLSWARGPLAHVVGAALDDARVIVRLCDVHDMIANHREAYDAILLDVDNGPEALIDLGNDRLYCGWGLRAAHGALRPGGVLAIWSSFQDEQFAERLRGARFEVEEFRIEAGDDAGENVDTIWIGIKLD